MKNSELWAQYDGYTKDLSANCRKIAFGAAAICWFFKSPDVIFPPAIIKALGFTVAFFMADILQYFTAAIVLRLWIRHQEKKLWATEQTIEGDYEKPFWLDFPAFTLWWFKVILLLITYIFIGMQLLGAQV